MPKDEKRSVSHVQSVARALELLEYMARGNRELSLTEIARGVNRPKTTVHGLIATLRDYHYVDQSMENGRYRLGVRLFELGNMVARGWDVRIMAKPAMQSLNARLGEMVQLAAEDRGEVLYLEKLDSTHLMRIVSEIGARLPMHCTGLGKVLLAYKKPAEVKRIVEEHGLSPMTEQTITDAEALMRELSRVKRQGYAIDDREVMDGLRCVAAPIFNSQGDVGYAISVSCLANNLHGARLDEVRRELIQAAENISYAMGYRKP